MNMEVNNMAIETCLRIFGVWPKASYISLRRLFWALSLGFEQIFQYRYIATHFHSIELPDMMTTLSEIMSYLIFFIKLCFLWYKQRTFNRILEIMAIDWENCTKFDIFAMTYNAKLSQRFANFTVTLYAITVIFYTSNIFVKHTTSNDKVSNSSTRPLVYDMELPFDINKRFVYEFVVIIQFLHLIICACAIGLINALLVNLILHVGGQIDILCDWLIRIFPSERKSSSGYFTIKELVRKHQRIIIFSEHIEDLFSNIAMVLFVSDIIIICSLGFVLVTSVERPDASKIVLRTLLFYFVMNMEAFVFCYAGEYLSAKSKSIGDAAYDSLWYESDSKSNRIILLMIMKSQNQLTITIGKVTSLSLERFTKIVKASASYISVLLAMY